MNPGSERQTGRPRFRPTFRNWRRWGPAVLVAAGGLAFALTVHRHEPIQGWLFFRYLRATMLATLFSMACLTAGHAVLVRALRRVLPLDEHLTIAFALGVLVFFFASFVFGLLKLYGLAFFVLGPCSLIALGARDFIRTAARLRRHVGRVDLSLSLGARRGAVLAYGCVGVLLIWVTIFSPRNASYDARWYHLPIAEHYVAQGGITAFREGWIPGALPQLASLIYAWAFSLPGHLFDRVEAAAHIEFAIFLMTLVGVAAIVRRTLRERAPLSWVALFLFPGIFCYDSGLVLGADHVAALWAPPIFLLCLRYWERPTRNYVVLLGAVVAGALDTKYTAAILLPLPLAVLIARAARRDPRLPRSAAWGSGAVAIASIVVLTSPHWLKNAVFYGDPLFPLLRRWFPSHPWSPAAEATYQAWHTLRRPPLSIGSILEMATTLATFSFVPHDFPQYHGELPVFGSLFTLCTPLFFFFGPPHRLWWLVGGSYAGIATWFWIHQFDRYLQVLVPWMAAATAVVLIRAWREGGVLRIATGSLIALQIVWGSAVPFLPAHRAAGSSIYKVVIDLLGRSDPKESADRLISYPDWEAIGRELPRDARVLVHEEEIHLGLAAAAALDYSGDQGMFYWGEPGASSPAQVWKRLRAHGISHVVWADHLDHATDTVAGGLVFFEFATYYTHRLGSYGGFALASLSDAAPSETAPREVAYYPCDPDPLFAPGIYPLEAMARAPGDARSVTPPIAAVSMDAACERAHFVVFDARCHGALPPPIRDQFELLAARGHSMMLVRRIPR